ncbi:hypothetical protein MVEN_02380400 [Mycena venus]|uniref:Uncharacterized protein n=1 Tax=Mycena venus TaxID=2733690 RepID=A0A8H7CEL5_9AGAR|nr:hypothetical protein MVEN_02380400 [Mycena venus]
MYHDDARTSLSLLSWMDCKTDAFIARLGLAVAISSISASGPIRRGTGKQVDLEAHVMDDQTIHLPSAIFVCISELLANLMFFLEGMEENGSEGLDGAGGGRGTVVKGVDVACITRTPVLTRSRPENPDFPNGNNWSQLGIIVELSSIIMYYNIGYVLFCLRQFAPIWYQLSSIIWLSDI